MHAPDIYLNHVPDSLPAGSGIIGALASMFVLLLFTDICLANVYSFTRSVKK